MKLRNIVRLFIAVFALSACSIVSAQHYVEIHKADGIEKGDLLSQLETASIALRNAFPSEYQPFFKVYDYGTYLYQNDFSYWLYPDKFTEIIETKITTPNYLIFGRELDKEGNLSRIRVELSLPSDGCFSSLSESTKEIINIEIKEEIGAPGLTLNQILIKEIQVINKLSDYITCFTACCGEPGISQCFEECLQYDFDDIASLIKQKGYLEFRFSQVSVLGFGSNDLDISFDFEVTELMTVPISFTDELDDFVSLVGGDPPSFFSYDFSNSINSDIDIPTIAEDVVYKENILIFKLPDDQYRLFYRISTNLTGTTPWGTAALTTGPTDFQELNDRSRVLVAPVIWLLKRCAMASIEVLVEVGIYWAFEKFASNCPWSLAWGELNFNYWSLMLSFADGFVSSTAFTALRALFEPLVIYIFTGEESRVSGLDWELAGKMLVKGFQNLLFEQAFGKVFKALGKVTSKQGRQHVADAIGDLNQKNLLLPYCKDLLGMGFDKFYKFVDNPKLFKSWEGLISGPDWVRKNVNLLEKLSEKGDDFIAKVDNFYKHKFQQPALTRRTPQGPPPYKAKTTHPNQASQVDVDYDEFGFPKFESHSLGPETYAKSDNLKGNMVTGVNPHPDNDFANQEFISKFGSDNIQILSDSGSPVLLKTDGVWKKYTWHHHQDGKTMMPVLSDVHNYTHHTGGRSMIGDEVHHFFDSPN